MAALRYSFAPGVSKSICLYDRFSSVFTTPTFSKREPIVPGPHRTP